MNKLKITIDGREYEVQAGENLLEACLNAGLDLPYFCWHPAMGSIGSCRQCAVIQYQNEEDTRGRIVMGCMTPVAEGARFSLQAAGAKDFREKIIEAMMTNHPHDCPVCAEGGECHLQDMTVMVGHRDRHYRGRKNTHRNQDLGPMIHHEMNRCITCYRCVRYYRDYAGGTDLSAQASHDHTYFGRQCDGVLESEFSGNLVEVCPTGVFTDKPLLKHYTRKWDLQSAPSVCIGCAVGCNISPGERYGVLKRVHNRYNNDVNGYFLCDRGRFGSGYINSERRLNFAGLRNGDGTFTPIHRDKAIATAANWIAGKNVVAIGSPRASLESNWLLKELVGEANFFAGVASRERAINGQILGDLQRCGVKTPSVKEMESADAVLILGEDVTQTAPRIALALRQAVRNGAYELGRKAGLPDWQDAAIRNLAQDQRSPLIIVSPMETRLDDVASDLVSLPPQEIAPFAVRILQCLCNEDPADDTVAAIADKLRKAERPLIIAGSSLLRADLVSAAGELAQALQDETRQPMLSYCLPEANTLGLTMLEGHSLDSLLERQDKVDTLVVLENDLSRRVSSIKMERLLAAADKVIVLDVLENSTLDNADLVLPAASYVESEGTLVNCEGRAQRYYPVFEPLEERQPGWQWLLAIGEAMGHSELAGLKHFDEVVQCLADKVPVLAAIAKAAPDHNYRSHGLKIPRQTHRHSGRTAINAAVSVHEPQQHRDQETPLAYSMEGLNRDQPSSLSPYVWSPGWNSNQAVQKFQSEAGGALRSGPAGVRLIEPGVERGLAGEGVRDSDSILKEHHWQLVPLYQLHGSDELTANTDEIAELAGDGVIAVGEVVAQNHGVADGDGLVVSTGEFSLTLEVKVLRRVAKNCVGYSAGFANTLVLSPGQFVTLSKDERWAPPLPRLIATDNPGGNHG